MLARGYMNSSQKIKFLIILFFSILATELLLYLAVNDSNQRTYNGYLDTKAKELQVKISSTINSFNLVSYSIFTEIVNNDKILSLYQKASSKDSTVQQNVRDSLLLLLERTYQNLRKIDIKQLHFHLPDNTSFLRFHRPEKFGDNLTNVRYTVKKTNETKKETIGFEEGRIFNGFRYVFPLLYNGDHLGSVETSFSFEGIGKNLNQLGIKYSCMMIKKDIVESKVFDDELSNYIACPISEDFLLENKYNHIGEESLEVISLINEKIKDEIGTLVNANKDFSKYAKIGEDTYIVSFVNIKNVENIPVAYIISYSRDETLSQLIYNNNAFLIVSMIVAAILLFFIGMFIASKIKTDELNKKLIQTSNHLIETNNKLEVSIKEKDKFFSIIAHDLRSPFSGFLGLSEILVNESVATENDEIIEISSLLKQSATKVYDLLENLLEWSRMQRDIVPFTPDTIILSELISYNIALLEPKIDSKSINVTNLVPENTFIESDNNMCNGIVRNILSNAVKFTPNGGNIEISSSIQGKFVALSIKDSGIGMSEELIGKLFSVSESTSRLGTNGEVKLRFRFNSLQRACREMWWRNFRTK